MVLADIEVTRLEGDFFPYDRNPWCIYCFYDCRFDLGIVLGALRLQLSEAKLILSKSNTVF